MGKRCTRYAALGEPQTLRRNSTSEVCDKCAQTGYRPEASPEELLNAVSSQEVGGFRVLRRNDKYCLFCGNYWNRLRTWGQIHDIQDSDQPLYFCEECAALVKRGWAMNDLLFVWEIGSAVPLEERFGGLFRAARALLREKAHEDRVLPTLAVEGLEIHAGRDQEPWTQEAVGFYANHPRVRPVRPELLKDGILILERREADVEVALEGDTVVITIAPRPKPPTPTEVAAAYEREMTSWGKPFDIEYKLSLDVVEASYMLYLRFAPIQPLAPGGLVNYPSPGLVSDVYRGLLGGSLRKGLETRPRGRVMQPDYLVPAIVAFYLRTYGGLHGGKAVYALLNEHVLCERSWSLPDGGDTDKHSVQLWKTLKAAHKHLVLEMFAL